MNLMQLFNPQAGAGSPQPGGGVMPAGGEDERRAFARALLMASSRLATQPGNFAQGLASAAGEGGLGYYNELDRLEADRLEEERWRGNQALQESRIAQDQADSDRRFQSQQENEKWDRGYKERDLTSRDAARRADATAKGRGEDADGLTEYQIQTLINKRREDVTKFYQERVASGQLDELQAADGINNDLRYYEGELRKRQKGQPQGIAADSDPRAALPSGTTSSGIQWSVEQ
jgi:hypothetical protein